VDLHVLLGEPAAGDLGDVLVLGRQHAVERLEEQDVDAEAAVGEAISAPEAPAPTTASGGQLVERPRLLRADHAAADGGAGNGLGTDPVARMTAFSALISSAVDLGRCPRRDGARPSDVRAGRRFS
jgi:hypothetical protein